MTTPNAYSFLPWLRTGLATLIGAAPQDPTKHRAQIPINLEIIGDAVDGRPLPPLPVGHTVQVYGPGDVIGVDPRAVSRTEPREWVTNFEPNFLAHIEFYDEDYLWRYSPAATDTSRNVRPWLALIVLAADQDGNGVEFTEGATPPGPLPFITVKDPAATLPPPDELGAWAHVHVNGEIVGTTPTNDPTAALAGLEQVLAQNADNACCRLICPRHLKPETGYHAFLVPSYENGRLAGLGQPPTAGATDASWGPAAGGSQLPYYHRWFFRTGTAGDFEFLVRLLHPYTAKDPVGRRDMDVHEPAGPGLPPITTPADIHGVLKLGGALRLPEDHQDVWDAWDTTGGVTYPQHPFQQALAALINLAEDYKKPGGATDPVITPPLYGRWHALTRRLVTDDQGRPIVDPQHPDWVHRLNLDPRFRVAANYGTRVVQEHKDEYMNAAWAQIGDVVAANNKIRAAQLAREVGHALQGKHVTPQPAATALAPAAPGGRPLRLTAPAHPRVTDADQTVGYQVAASNIGAAPVSPTMRRATRPASRLIKSLFTDDRQGNNALLPKMELGTVTAAPAWVVPEAVVTPAKLDGALHPVPTFDDDPVGKLPFSSNFQLSVPEDNLPPPSTGGQQDSHDAANFKDALRDMYHGFDAAAVGGSTAARPPLPVAAVTDVTMNGLRADLTVPRNLLASVNLPPRLRSVSAFAATDTPDQPIDVVMAYPVIDLPMFRPLLALSVDLFVPNLNLVPPNTVTLLDTNQEFIESYLVGLNHELGREMLWREYPTDQRGSVFRQFWDERTALSTPGESEQQRRQRLYDITPIDTWGKRPLGANNNRRPANDQQDTLVLIIRGELLKKYPTAAIYAQAAVWQDDHGKERLPCEPLDPNHPTDKEIRMPLWECKVEPDIYLLGFDLTAAQAKGDGVTDPGWFFVIKERPGDPRFGADIDTDGPVELWDDLSWPLLDPGDRHGFLQFGDGVSVTLNDLSGEYAQDPLMTAQHDEDTAVAWQPGISSADVAYLLFQAPVLLAVHAQEMLPHDDTAQ
ncbi:hypothetical protein [Kutzneria chonburiensis]|uniref:Uncharacterized protein n=1 Tax=Kutzneria chonburiensis TaxID=1483604 RepID=A0ABV6MQD9_9PSEU|nr:hypothetical protein [Kutzneria chonburiensis]